MINKEIPLIWKTQINSLHGVISALPAESKVLRRYKVAFISQVVASSTSSNGFQKNFFKKKNICWYSSKGAFSTQALHLAGNSVHQLRIAFRFSQEKIKFLSKTVVKNFRFRRRFITTSDLQSWYPFRWVCNTVMFQRPNYKKHKEIMQPDSWT